MDKKEFYEKTEQVLNQAFEVTKKSAKVVAEKAGEAAHVTKLLIEKLTLEHKVAKQFAKIGGRVYEKTAREGQASFVQDSELKSLIEDTKKLETELAQVETALGQEQKKKKPIRV